MHAEGVEKCLLKCTVYTLKVVCSAYTIEHEICYIPTSHILYYIAPERVQWLGTKRRRCRSVAAPSNMRRVCGGDAISPHNACGHLLMMRRPVCARCWSLALGAHSTVHGASTEFIMNSSTIVKTTISPAAGNRDIEYVMMQFLLLIICYHYSEIVPKNVTRSPFHYFRI